MTKKESGMWVIEARNVFSLKTAEWKEIYTAEDREEREDAIRDFRNTLGPLWEFRSFWREANGESD